MNTQRQPEQRDTAQPKKPFHPRLDVALQKMRCNIVPELSVSVVAEAYDELHAHAERLAEALKNASTWFSAIVSDEHDGANVENMKKHAREALADWIKAQ